MYFIVEQPSGLNRHVIDLEGQPHPLGVWLSNGWVVHDVEPPPPRRPSGERVEWEHEQTVGPYLFGPSHGSSSHKRWTPPKEKHVLTEEFESASTVGVPLPPRYVEEAPYLFQESQGNFEKRVGVATSNKREGIAQAANLGRFVFHLTTLRNLLTSPDSARPGTGIIATGLDPARGGGAGGACETAIVEGHHALVTDSIKGSVNRVAVNTLRSNLRMYANQRLDMNRARFAEGAYEEHDLTEREPILLRFRLVLEDIKSMSPDPVHPDQGQVRLIEGRGIAPDRLEGLTSEGWVPVSSLAAQLAEIMPSLGETAIRGPRPSPVPGGTFEIAGIEEFLVRRIVPLPIHEASLTHEWKDNDVILVRAATREVWLRVRMMDGVATRTSDNPRGRGIVNLVPLTE